MSEHAVDDMQYVRSDIQHDDASDDALDGMIAGAAFTEDATPLPDSSDDNPFDEFLHSDEPSLDAPDVTLIEPKRKPPNAKKYERKVAGLFSLGVKITATHDNTLADSAAMLMYGPDISEKMGTLAASNARVARAIDMITDQTENPATAAMMATLPLVLQVVRNHEPVVEKQRERPARTWRIPFTKRQIRFRVGWQLGRRMRGATTDPVALKRHVFTNPQIQEALKKQGISVNVT